MKALMGKQQETLQVQEMQLENLDQQRDVYQKEVDEINREIN
jgi:hypothetical protein